MTIGAAVNKSLQPETAVNSWQQWGVGLSSRPVILGPLSGGLSNRSFLLDSNGSKMVLRLNSPNTRLPGANRTCEIDIWQAASKHGIAPRLLHADQHTGYLVSTYIENGLPPQPPFAEAYTKQALDLLRRCHELEVEADHIDYSSHIERYWHIIEGKQALLNPALLQQRQVMQELLETLINSGTPEGLCHHDPVVANFVGNTERLYLIDWEYAVHGLQVMDYAAMCVEWEVDDTLILDQTRIKPGSLAMAKSFYVYLCNLWKEVTLGT